MGRILTHLALRKKAFAALNGRQEVSVSDDEASGVATSIAKGDGACLTAGDVRGCSIDGAEVTLTADGYADNRLVPAASVSVAEEAAKTAYLVKPRFYSSPVAMAWSSSSCTLTFKMLFDLYDAESGATTTADYSMVPYSVKGLYLRLSSGTGGTISFYASLKLNFAATHYAAAGASLVSATASPGQCAWELDYSAASRLVKLSYTFTDATVVAELYEYYTAVQNGYYKLSLTGATSHGDFDNSDYTITT